MTDLEYAWGPLLHKQAKRWTGPTATYKGREYGLMFVGPTKYGERAHLSFLDGSKDFWVDARLVGGPDVSGMSSVPSSRRPSREETWPANGFCPVCNHRHRYAPCGYPGCNPGYCDECDGGGKYCHA